MRRGLRPNPSLALDERGRRRMNRDRALHCTVLSCVLYCTVTVYCTVCYVRVTEHARPHVAPRSGVCTFVRRRAEQPRAPSFHKSRQKVLLSAVLRSSFNIVKFATPRFDPPPLRRALARIFRADRSAPLLGVVGTRPCPDAKFHTSQRAVGWAVAVERLRTGCRVTMSGRSGLGGAGMRWQPANTLENVGRNAS
jgi:hypothetical protein